MARPKSEDKKLALLEAATTAIAQSGIAASTAVIARNAGVAEGTLFRYFATKDELINELYLHLKHSLCQSMIARLDRSLTDAKAMTLLYLEQLYPLGAGTDARAPRDTPTGGQRENYQRDRTKGRRHVS